MLRSVSTYSKNFGFSKAINIGAPHAKGEYICFLNPDTLSLTMWAFGASKKTYPLRLSMTRIE